MDGLVGEGVCGRGNAEGSRRGRRGGRQGGAHACVLPGAGLFFVALRAWVGGALSGWIMGGLGVRK
eukprot:7387695-Prymnesium_polylepis.1